MLSCKVYLTQVQFSLMLLLTIFKPTLKESNQRTKIMQNFFPLTFLLLLSHSPLQKAQGTYNSQPTTRNNQGGGGGSIDDIGDEEG